MRAAYGSGQADHLALLARKLGEGALADGTGREIADAFVQALADFSTLHLSLLHAFEQSSNELGLADGSPAFDRVPASLNRVQLETSLAGAAYSLDAVLAVTLRHGLIEVRYPGGGMSLSTGPSIPSYALTSFGGEFLAQLRAVGGALADD